MPLSESGMKVLKAMRSQYGGKKGTSVFYASKNAGNPGSDKWEKNPGPEAPAGEHVAAIHSHMSGITDSLGRIADHVEKLKAIQARKKQQMPSLGALANPVMRIKL